MGILGTQEWFPLLKGSLISISWLAPMLNLGVSLFIRWECMSSLVRMNSETYIYPISSVGDMASLESHHSAKGWDVQRRKEVPTEEPEMPLGFYEQQPQRIFTKTSLWESSFSLFYFHVHRIHCLTKTEQQPQFSSSVQAPWSPHAGRCICQCLVIPILCQCQEEQYF